MAVPLLIPWKVSFQGFTDFVHHNGRKVPVGLSSSVPQKLLCRTPRKQTIKNIAKLMQVMLPEDHPAVTAAFITCNKLSEGVRISFSDLDQQVSPL